MSSDQTPKSAKPKIEDVILQRLDGDMRKNALNFAAYLRANKISPVYTPAGSWKASNKGRGICYIHVNSQRWCITPFLDHLNQYRETVINERLQDIIWNSLFYCENCKQNCSHGRDMTILGKKFEKICPGRPPIEWHNPDEKAIGHIKRLLNLEKEARKDGSKSPFAHFRFYNDI